MMFQLLKFSENPASHKIDVTVEYDLSGGGHHKTSAVFDTKELAAKWINHVQTLYIRTKWKDFITHKIILSQKSNTWTTPELKDIKLHALEKCRRELSICMEYPLDYICSVVVLLEKELTQILPMPYSNSYKSSFQNLDAILLFCKEPKKSIHGDS